MKIGLISDTHGFLDPSIQKHCIDCDEIWHAGDIGNIQVLETLQHWKPTKAVYGNIDDQNIQVQTQLELHFSIFGLRFSIIHIGAKPPSYNSHIKNWLAIHNPNIMICGHSHILAAIPDKSRNLIYLNPGAAGYHGFHQVRTIMRFQILPSGKIDHLEVIELGKRSAITF